ncbi:MAG: site-specific DNA-methyltransferase, partial [Thiotrichales bacterium]|nr:site-specific DNA-methyltransferase [Thiotrichales bacterium]
RGKDEQNWSDLVVQAPPLFIQEKVHPKALINDLLRHSKTAEAERLARESGFQVDLFADFNGLPSHDARTEFYQHNANWSNRMILGDSLQVMASLAEREGLRGKVQCIYLDPPYGIKFNSNFQWSTTSRDVKDGKADHITREPEQVKAFRDTWRDGIHSYLTYLRDRLTVARDLLTESGSIFVQIGDENFHRVRAMMDEVFGPDNFVVTIKFSKTSGLGGKFLDETFDYLIWCAKNIHSLKFRRPFIERVPGEAGATQYNFSMRLDGIYSPLDADKEGRAFAHGDLTSQTGNETTVFSFSLKNVAFPTPKKGGWKSNSVGIERLRKANRIIRIGNTPRYVRYFDDAPFFPMGSGWLDTGISGFGAGKAYVVQTHPRVVERCILMTTDPSDLVLDPTCGSGTTAQVAEQWGRRWITIDTSRVALALARARIMGARYPWYLLADSPEGQQKEGEITRKAPSESPTGGDIRQGFVYERVPHITLKSIANNAEIDVIWERWQETLEPLREELNAALATTWEEWEIPRESGEPWPDTATAAWNEIRKAEADEAKTTALRRLNAALGRDYAPDDVPDSPRDPWLPSVTDLHTKWWEARIARQREIDASIAARADFEYLYDRPYEDRKKVRVAGPFTVESISPHRALGVDENDELIDHVAEARASYGTAQDFGAVILEHLRMSGVQQPRKEDRITFSSVTPWPGDLVCADGRYLEGGDEAAPEKRAAIFIGPEFGTVARPDLVAAAREAADAGFDVLVACAFNYEAHASELRKLGRVPILKARMNADLHMAGDLKNTGKGNLFVIFGEPDIDLLRPKGDGADAGRFQVKLNGVDVFHPNTGEIHSDGADGIACWFIDTDYDEESFFVRHAYFLGAGDPYKALKTTLKAEINQDAWATLRSDLSRPFDPPSSGRIAVKVINHLGDEVMKVFRV